MKARYGMIALAAAVLLSKACAESVYTLSDENGVYITARLGRMYAGDEYISGENLLYEVVRVDDEAHSAVARLRGEEPQEAERAFAASGEARERLILMYSTHSDESYIEGDGDYSLVKNAGIYDVGRKFERDLEKLGYTVEYSGETFLPHDAGAYRRSRAVAARYAGRMPLAILDIHRDGIDADEYETTVDGKKMSMVRLFVGKSNANSAENRAFAKNLKAIADERYPGLIKDIYIGRGNYNQDLYPSAILLEFGTHKIDKELVLDSTEYMAEVLNEALGGEKDARVRAEEKEAAKEGFRWQALLAVGAVILLALFAAGSFRGGAGKIRDGFREMTGGLFSGKNRKK